MCTKFKFLYIAVDQSSHQCKSRFGIAVNHKEKKKTLTNIQTTKESEQQQQRKMLINLCAFFKFLQLKTSSS